jgi:hypothetical protein
VNSNFGRDGVTVRLGSCWMSLVGERGFGSCNGCNGCDDSSYYPLYQYTIHDDDLVS